MAKNVFRLPSMFRDPVKEQMDDMVHRTSTLDTELQAITSMMEWFYRLPSDHDRKRVLNYIADRVLHERPLAVDEVRAVEPSYKFED